MKYKSRCILSLFITKDYNQLTHNLVKYKGEGFEINGEFAIWTHYASDNEANGYERLKPHGVFYLLLLSIVLFTLGKSRTHKPNITLRILKFFLFSEKLIYQRLVLKSPQKEAFTQNLGTSWTLLLRMYNSYQVVYKIHGEIVIKWMNMEWYNIYNSAENMNEWIEIANVGLRKYSQFVVFLCLLKYYF